LRTISQGVVGNRQFTAVAFHPDGQLVAADRNCTNVVLWKVSDGTPVWETFGNRLEIESIAFSPDGQWLAAGGYESGSFAGGVELWRLSDWSQYRRFPITAPSVAFSPDGRLLVTQRTRAMEFWSVPDSTLLGSVGVPGSDLYGRHLSVAVSPQGDRTVTGNYRQIATPNGPLTESGATAIRFPVMLSADLQNGNLTLNWTGGYPLYQVQRRSFDTSVWLNFGGATTTAASHFLWTGRVPCSASSKSRNKRAGRALQRGRAFLHQRIAVTDTAAWTSDFSLRVSILDHRLRSLPSVSRTLNLLVAVSVLCIIRVFT
jgi:WD40 repeat protein